KEIATQQFYVVFSGRWFRAKAMSGPWTWVANNALPSCFTAIPESSVRGEVLAYVAGTTQADEARMDAEVPQTAAVDRATAKLEVKYDGEPKFEKIEGTSVQYAKNASAQVLLIDGRYYACSAAIWFTSASAAGPWVVADSIPKHQIDQLPPESPVYNVKYVSIYQSTPQVVYVGYLPGYVGCYPYHGAVVYGTGYYYSPWIGPRYYYPPPPTYGFHAHYNPYMGWSFGMSWSTGWGYVRVGWGGGYGYMAPPYRPPYYRPPGYYPPGYRPPHGGYPGYRPPGGGYPGYGPRPTPYGGASVSQRPSADNVYNRGPNSGAARPAQLPAGGGGSAASRPTGGAASGASASTRPAGAGGSVGSQPANRPAQPARQPNNVYADRSGNVYRQGSNGSWQQNSGGGWQNSPNQQPSRPSTGTGASPGRQPSRGASGAGSMNSQAQARDRGTQRSSSGAAQRGGSGGASRGGGGRR
ncbi:MAG: carbohydrate-binding family V/XII, partial [Candidatus Eiseniibacteriota bacterium]